MTTATTRPRVVTARQPDVARAAEVAAEARRRLELVLDHGLPGAAEPPAVRRGLMALVVELRGQVERQGWGEERDVCAELVLLLESPSKLAGVARKLRAAFAWFEQRLRDRMVAAKPSLLSDQEWQRRVA